MRFFYPTEWSKQKEITINFAEITLSELDQRLRQFYAEARSQDGGNHSIAEQHYLPSEMASRDTLIRLQTIVGFRWSEIPNLFCQTRC